MNRLELEAKSVKAMSSATDELIAAAYSLASAGDLAGAKRANRAAAEVNAQNIELCDAVLARPWVRFFNWLLGT